MRILIASRTFGKYSQEHFQKLEALGAKRVTLTNQMTEEETIDVLKGATVIVIGGNGRITSKVIDGGPSLKLIVKHGIGLDNIDVEAATKKGVLVISARHTKEEISVAEHTIGLLLAIARHIPEGTKLVKDGKWNERAKLVGSELYGKTLGIVGLGAIGSRVARIAKEGFQMNVIAYDPYIPEATFASLGVKRTDLKELLSISDFITIHVPLTKETRNLLNANMLQNVNPRAIIINTSRGAVIGEQALAEAVMNAKIFGVALDVMESEPPKLDNPLLGLDQAIITPHIATYTFEALERMDRYLIEDILRFAKGERPLKLVNPEVLNIRRDKYGNN